METVLSEPAAARSSPDFLAVARELAPHVRAGAAGAEASRDLARDLVRTLAASGLFRMWVPRSYGGFEVDPVTCLRVIEELARADSAAAWVTAIATGTSHYAASRLAPPAALAVYGGDPTAFSCGFVAPRGRAVAVPGGHRVSGRWPFGSGCRHAAWLMAPCWLHEGGSAAVGADGTPAWRSFVLPAADCRVLDTWNAFGMRGTGSHDYTAEDVFVPHERSISLLDPPRHGGALYSHTGLFLLNIAGVPLGIAAVALTHFADGARLERHRQGFSELARAQAQVEAARAFLLDAAAELWETLAALGEPTVRQRTRYRLALTHAFDAPAQAIALLHQASGIGATGPASPIGRAFRDLSTLLHHRSVAVSTYHWLGKMLLGRVPRQATLLHFA